MFSLSTVIFYEINRLFKLRDIVMKMEMDEGWVRVLRVRKAYY